MRAPRIPRSKLASGVDYSPTEVAELDLLKIGRSAIYNWIRNGTIRTVKNARGQLRITQEEVDRLQQEWKILPDESTRATWLEHERQREYGRAGAKKRLALHGGEAVAAPMLAGKQQAFERKVDPNYSLPADERARRAKDLWDSELASARAERADRQRRRLQFATHRGTA